MMVYYLWVYSPTHEHVHARTLTHTMYTHLYLLCFSTYIQPSTYLSIYIYPSIYISLHLHLSIYQSVYLSIYLYIFLAIHIHLYTSVPLSLFLSKYVHVYTLVSLSLSFKTTTQSSRHLSRPQHKYQHYQNITPSWPRRA